MTATAQRRRRQVAKRPARPAAAAASAATADSREAAEKVSDQIKNLTRFLYLFGRLSNGLEMSEEQSAQQQQQRQRGRGGDNAQDGLERTKSGLLESVRNVRLGLEDLESYFESTPAARRYYANVAGVASDAGNAEAHVSAGEYDQAGRSLIGVVNKLIDVLAQIR